MILLLTTTILTMCNQEKIDEIKFIDVDKVLADSGLQAQEQTHLAQVLDTLQQGHKLAEKQYPSFTKDKVDAARKSDEEILYLQWQNEQVAARKTVLRIIQHETQLLQKEQKLSAILPLQSALAVDDKVNITQALITRLKGKKVTFTPLPKVTLKSDDKDDNATHSSP